MIDGFNQDQKSLSGNCDLHLFQEALATRLLFGVDLLVVREAQLERDSHLVQSQFENWTDFGGFFRGSLVDSMNLKPKVKQTLRKSW